MLGEDMAVYYGPGGVSEEFTRVRIGEPEVAFWAIFGVIDTEALQGYALTAVPRLLYATASVELVEGDTVVRAADGVEYRLRRAPERRNDGAESEALLSTVE